MANSAAAPHSSIHQASCVAIDGRAILIEGKPGSGKSSLALSLIDRGGVLVGDDGVQLENREGMLWASPPPNIAGKLEIRGVGIIDLPVTKAPIALRLTLTAETPRFIERPPTAIIHSVHIPSLAFYPHSPVAAIRAEYALRLHGLASSGT